MTRKFLDTKIDYVISVALYCEAELIIKEFSLKKIIDLKKFQIFINNNIALIVTGTGQINAAIALTYLCENLKLDQNISLINFGIAGYADLKIGNVILADKISNADEKKSFYPTLIKEITHNNFVNLKTVVKPESDYRENYMYDMEAYGFCLAAEKYTDRDKIFVIKIISDNRENHIKQITAKYVKDLVINNSESIFKIFKEIFSAKNKDDELDKDVADFLESLCYSYSEKNIIKNLLYKLGSFKQLSNLNEYDEQCFKELKRNLINELESQELKY